MIKKIFLALFICIGALWLWSHYTKKGTLYEKTVLSLPDTATVIQSDWL